MNNGFFDKHCSDSSPDSGFSSGDISDYENTFDPCCTLVIQNFSRDASMQVHRLASLFGPLTHFHALEEEGSSAFAVLQYRHVRFAVDALVGISGCKIRSSSLVAQPLWHGPYDHLNTGTGPSSAFTEKRVVFVSRLPRDVLSEGLYKRCMRFGKVSGFKMQHQEQVAIAYIIYESRLSAAIAACCLNDGRSEAALLVGYRSQPLLMEPGRIWPRNMYRTPLSAFDVHCLYTRLLSYSRLKGFFVDRQRQPAPHNCFRSPSSEFCVRIPTCKLKGVLLFMEVLLFEKRYLDSIDEFSDIDYRSCHQKYLLRFSVDFGLHKPSVRRKEGNCGFLRWSSFFALDMEFCFPWGIPQPAISARVQELNHFYSELESAPFEDERATFWFGRPVRHSCVNVTHQGTTRCDELQYQNKIKFLLAERFSFVRLLGSFEDLNHFQLPVHVYSENRA